MPHEFDRDGIVQRTTVSPNVWTDGGLVLDKVSGASSVGSGMYARVSGHAWRHRQWELLDVMRLADEAWRILVGGFVLFLVSCRQFRGLSLGVKLSLIHWLLRGMIGS